MTRIFIATREGLHIVDGSGNAEAVQHDGRSITAIMRDGPELWAIIDGREVWRAPDTDWSEIAVLESGLKATCLAMTNEVLVGTSEARLFRLNGRTLEAVSPFDGVEGRGDWYTPWGGPPATRSFSEWDDDIYVNVHVGGIVHTDDRGQTWNPTIDVDADVHQVATAEGQVLAACAGGLGTSTDRGATWAMRSDGLHAPYSRAVVVCGDAVLVSASNGPRGGQAAVYRGGLTDGSFERCVTGLPAWFDDNIDTYCLDALNDGSFAAFGTADGRLYGSADAGSTWTELAADLPSIQHVLVVPD